MSALAPPPRPRADYRCGACAYGISIAGTPEVRCPMCGSVAWLPVPNRRAAEAR